MANRLWGQRGYHYLPDFDAGRWPDGGPMLGKRYNHDGIVEGRGLADPALRTLATAQELPAGIAADGNSVFWVVNDGEQQAIMRLRQGSASPSLFARVPGSDALLANDATHLYVVFIDTSRHLAAHASAAK